MKSFTLPEILDPRNTLKTVNAPACPDRGSPFDRGTTAMPTWTNDEISDALKYARQLSDERVLRAQAVLIYQDLVLRFGGAKTGRTIVPVAELAGDGIGRSTTYGYLNDLEAAHLIVRERRGACTNGQPQRLASCIHIRTAAEAKALALEEATRKEIAERAVARERPVESPDSGQGEGVLEDSNTCCVGTMLTADEARAKWLPMLPPLPEPSAAHPVRQALDRLHLALAHILPRHLRRRLPPARQHRIAGNGVGPHLRIPTGPAASQCAADKRLLIFSEPQRVEAVAFGVPGVAVQLGEGGPEGGPVMWRRRLDRVSHGLLSHSHSAKKTRGRSSRLLLSRSRR